MRNLTALLFLLSLCSLHLVLSAPSSLDHLTKCCRNITEAKIPLKKIVTYWKTSSSCSKKAIVFETVGKKKFCVNPMGSWVSSHMKSVDGRKKATLKS